MLKYLILSAFFFVTGCSPADQGGQGHRENQEEATTPNDYTRGTDSRTKPQTNR